MHKINVTESQLHSYKRMICMQKPCEGNKNYSEFKPFYRVLAPISDVVQTVPFDQQGEKDSSLSCIIESDW